METAANTPIPNKKITAAGLLCITTDNKILAFARGSNKSMLGLPAGKREKGEDLATTARREVFEETGLNIKIPLTAETFVYQPDDKKVARIKEYCATFIVHSEKSSSDFSFTPSNLDHEGNPEGFAVWVTPEEFVHAERSAFHEYNTALLKFAGLMD